MLQQAVHLHAVVLVPEACVYRLASRRKLVYHRHVQVAVHGHGQCARYRCGGHHQYMRRYRAFAPHPGALRHTEAVLLVNHRHAEALEFYGIFYQGVSSYQYVDVAVLQRLVQFAAFLGPGASGQQLHTDAYLFAPSSQCLVMLRCKYLGGSHQRALATVVYGHQQGHERHHGLAGAYVALQQTIHLPSGAHVVADLVQHALLRPGQLERDALAVIVVEHGSNLQERYAGYALAALAGIAQYIELQIEQFLELHPLACLAQHIGRGRKMQFAQCVVQRHQMKHLPHLLGQRILHLLHPWMLQQSADQRIERLGRKTALTRRVREIVHSAKAGGRLGGIVYGHFGVRDRPYAAVFLRLAEDDVFLADPVVVFHRLGFGKPYAFHQPVAVGEYAAESHPRAFALKFELQEPSAYLHGGHLPFQFLYLIEPALVEIAEREIVQQLAHRADAELLLQRVGPERSHTLQIHYVCFPKRIHFSSTCLYGPFPSQSCFLSA